MFKHPDDIGEKFCKAFFIRWAILFLVGCLVVHFAVEGDLVGLVRAGGAPLNKYLYALGASAIVALMSLKRFFYIFC